MKKVKSLHEAELLAADERAASKYVAATEDLRDQLTHEKDRSVGRERELAQVSVRLQGSTQGDFSRPASVKKKDFSKATFLTFTRI